MENKDAVVLPPSPETVADLATKPWWETLQFLPADYQGDPSRLIAVKHQVNHQEEVLGYLKSELSPEVLVPCLSLVTLPSKIVAEGVQHFFNNPLTAFSNLYFYTKESLAKEFLIEESLAKEFLTKKESVMKKVNQIKKVNMDQAEKEPSFFFTAQAEKNSGGLISLSLEFPDGQKKPIFALSYAGGTVDSLKNYWQKLAVAPQKLLQTAQAKAKAIAADYDQINFQELFSLENDQSFQEVLKDDWTKKLQPAIQRIRQCLTNLTNLGSEESLESFPCQTYSEIPPKGQIINLEAQETTSPSSA